jgi:hypothetical protein
MNTLEHMLAMFDSKNTAVNIGDAQARSAQARSAQAWVRLFARNQNENR